MSSSPHTGRYRSLRHLGTGAFAEVSLARDILLDRVVVLKRARTDVEGAERELEHEFAFVAPLNHPGIARAVDMGRDDEGLFVAFEARDGSPSHEVCAQASPDRVVGWCVGLAETLDYLHRLGILHGDIKPENVLLVSRPSGELPLLIDFGLARRRGERGGGTLATVAPEVLRGGETTEQSDLFSLGATLFFWLSGRYPFGDDVTARLADDRGHAPLHASVLEALGEPAAQLLDKLLAAEPESRPVDAREVVDKLIAAGTPHPDPALSDPAVRSHSLSLRGRDDLIERLADCWAGEATEAKFFALTGPPRSGRSRLAHHVAQQARLSGRRVLELSANRDVAPGQLLAAALEIDASQFGNASEPSVALEALTERGPLCVVIDDLDEMPGEFQRHVLRLPDRLASTSNLSIVICLRTETALSGWERLELGPVSIAELTAIVKELLFDSHPSRELMSRLADATLGIPGLLVDLLVNAVGRELVAPTRAGWELSPLESQPLTKLVARDGSPPALPDDARQQEILAAIAASEVPVHLFELPFVTGQDADRVAHGVQQLARWRAVRRLSSGRLQLAPGVKVPVTDETHGRWVAYLAQHDTRPRRRHVEARIRWIGRLARHLGYVRRMETSARLAFRAVSRALLDGRPDLAGAVLAGLPPLERYENTARARLDNAAGEIHLSASRWDRAAPCLERAARGYLKADRPRDGARALTRCARAYAHADAERALELLDRAARLSRDRNIQAMARLETGILHARQLDLDAALAALDEAAQLAAPDSLVQARARAARGRCLVLLGRIEQGERELARARSGASTDRSLIAAINLAEAQALLIACAPRRVNALYEQTRDLLIVRGEADGLGILNRTASLAALALERWDIALEHARHAVRWRRVHGDPRWLGFSLALVAQIELAFGHLAGASATLDRVDDTLGQTHSSRLSAEVLTLRSHIERHREQPEAALDFARRALERAHACDNADAIGEALIALGCAKLDAGDFPGAVTDLSEAVKQLEPTVLSSRSRAEALACLADALVGSAPERALALSAQALELAERHGAFDAELRALFVAEQANNQLGHTRAARRLRARGISRIDQLASRFDSDENERAFCDRRDRRGWADRQGSTGTVRLRTLYDIVAELNSATDPREVVERLLDRALEALHADRGAIVLANDEGELKIVHSRQVEKRTQQDALQLSQTILRRAHGGEAVLALDPAADLRFASAASVRLFDIRAVLCVPLRIKDRVMGAIYVDTREPDQRFDSDDLQFVEALADHASLALQNAREVERLNRENQELKTELGRKDRLGPIVGSSQPMRQLFARVESVAPSDLPVLILGESGTGKELVARTVHRLGPHEDGPFVAVNCAALPDDLLEATLFGHLRGAFTGADRARIGLFQQASGGTLFLDEIGDMPLTMQAKLLRVLEEKKVRPLGAAEEEPVDFRLVAATNRDLDEMVRSETFRHDLLFRIDVLRLSLPPLRERIEDLPLLARHLVSVLEPTHGPLKIDPALIDRLARWHWPGNVRELENVLARMALHADGSRLTTETLTKDPELASRFSGDTGDSSAPRLDDLEKDAIRKALEFTSGNRNRAARLLGIGRATIFRKIREYDLADVGREPGRPGSRPMRRDES